jgi:hypothetical protein
MGIQVMPTPNPIAMKLVVGSPVGGPKTVRAGEQAEEAHISELVAIEGVASVFFTADFFTITKIPTADWDRILARAVPILERHFGE